jgi:hypothetical protein
MVPFWSQRSLVHTLPPNISMIQFNIIFPSLSDLQRSLFPSDLNSREGNKRFPIWWKQLFSKFYRISISLWMEISFINIVLKHLKCTADSKILCAAIRDIQQMIKVTWENCVHWRWLSLKCKSTTEDLPLFSLVSSTLFETALPLLAHLFLTAN